MKEWIFLVLFIPGVVCAGPIMDFSTAPATGSISTFAGSMYDFPSTWPVAVNFSVTVTGNTAKVRNYIGHNGNPTPGIIYFEMGSDVNLLTGSSSGSRCFVESRAGICYLSSDLSNIFGAFVADWVVDITQVSWQWGNTSLYGKDFVAWNKGFYYIPKFKNATNSTLTLATKPPEANVPQPGSVALMMTGLFGLGLAHRRRRRREVLSH